MKSLAYILFASSLLVSSSAQISPPASGKSETVEITFRTLAWSEPITDVFFKGPKTVQLSIYSHSRSSSYFYRGKADLPLTFFRSKTTPDDKIIEEPVATIPADELKDHSLFLFIPSAENPSYYNVKVLDDRVETLPAGGYRFFNNTNRMLGLTVGEQKQLLAIGSDAIMIPKPSGTVQNATGIQIFIDDNGAARRVYANRWAYQREVRSLIFILNDPESKRVLLKGIDEMVKPTSPAGG